MSDGMSDRIMGEKQGSRLPNLDYHRLGVQRLLGLRRSAKGAPAGKWENLIEFIGQRSGKRPDAAEIDRRMRTFFEDMITRVTKSPADFDKDVTINGKALMDYLSGMPMPGEEPGP